MLRPSEIRSVPIYNAAYVTIANRMGNIVDLRHCRRRIRLGHGVDYFALLFGPEPSAVIASVRLSPLLVWTWNDPEDGPAGYADIILGIIPR